MLPVPEAVVTSTPKESLRSTERGAQSSRCSIGVKSADYKVPCRTLTKFCSEGKVMLGSLSSFAFFLTHTIWTQLL